MQNYEIDKLIAEKIMGYEFVTNFIGDVLVYVTDEDVEMFSPSTNMSDAWKVLEKFTHYQIQKLPDGNVQIEGEKKFQCWIEKNSNYAISETAPMAICLAALKMKG